MVYLRHRKFQWSSTTSNALGTTFTTRKENIFALNLEPKINDFRKCLQQWQHRKLTLMGKITVIKNFALPKLIYALSSLPTPSDEIIKQIEKIMYNFIWDGKPEKIKREVLIKDYSKGGLKMIEIRTFITSLKISWLKRILANDSNKFFKHVYMSRLEQYGGKLFFESNYSEKDIDKIMSKQCFFKDILKVWCKTNYKNCIPYYRNEIIWNNSNIKAGGDSIFYLSWHQKGIKYFKDLYNDAEHRFFTFTEVKTKYALPNGDFLKYLSLINSIPNTWKRNIRQENIDIPVGQPFINNLLKAIQPNKYVYSHILNKVINHEKRSEAKWNEMFTEDSLNWSLIYTNTLRTTHDIKLQNFQYKYLLRIIPTNKFLLKCNIGTSALCDFCVMEIETVNHLFWECIHVQHFWRELSHFLSNCNINIPLNLKTVSFGITHKFNETDKQVQNFIIVSAKYFIFRNKYQKTVPSFRHYMSFLKNRLKIEKEIYFLKDRLAQFSRKWDNFIMHLHDFD